MEKRKWPWNRKSSERSPGEGESHGSVSSQSERYSDEQEGLRESPNNASQSPEVTSKATTTTTLTDEQVEGTMKALTEKLSAALVNVSAKEELVKQHAKVAEEAIVGWEKAENEVAALKQQLDFAVQQNLNLEVRSSHLESALRECVKQLRQARDEAMVEKHSEWETQKADLEKQIADLKVENSAAIDPNILLTVETLEKENASLRQELMSRCKVLEVIVNERDLSTRAAETASKLQLESIKKVAKLEAECRRLQSMVQKSSSVIGQKSVVTSPYYAESSCSDSLAVSKNLAGCSVEIDMMDDFLEMERLARLSDTKNDTSCESDSASRECTRDDDTFKAEIESATQQVAELEKKVEQLEEEKLRLQIALDECMDSLMAAQRRVAKTETKLEELQRELGAVNEMKELIEFKLVGMEAEAKATSSSIQSLKAEMEEERKLSSELASRCEELEKELTRRVQENEVEQHKKSNWETKIKQEDLAVAADKLAECQKTIASLGRQLQSLATLEDFLIETPEMGGVGCKGMLRKYDVGQLRMSLESYNNLTGGGIRNGDSSNKQLSCGKSWSSFGRMFSPTPPSKSVVEVEHSSPEIDEALSDLQRGATERTESKGRIHLASAEVAGTDRLLGR